MDDTDGSHENGPGAETAGAVASAKFVCRDWGLRVPSLSYFSVRRGAALANRKEIVKEPELLGVEQGAKLARTRHPQMVGLLIF